MKEIENIQNYLQTLEEIKITIKTSQIKAHVFVNIELLILYWQIGKIVVNKQKQEGWGTKVVKRLSVDLQKEFLNMKGLSYTNIRYMQRFYKNYPDLLICHQPGGKLIKSEEVNYEIVTQIPWRHNIAILDKVRLQEQRLWYAQKTIENGWSRSVLEYHIKTKLYERQAVLEVKTHNFNSTLPAAQSDLAGQLLKDKYNFEFLAINQKDNESKLEQALIDDIVFFILELGIGVRHEAALKSCFLNRREPSMSLDESRDMNKELSRQCNKMLIAWGNIREIKAPLATTAG